jgi:hypothetical protein
MRSVIAFQLTRTRLHFCRIQVFLVAAERFTSDDMSPLVGEI